MKRVTNDDYFILIWGEKGTYDIVNPAKNYVSMGNFHSESDLKLNVSTKGVQVYPLSTLHPKILETLLSGYLLGTGITLEGYLSLNNPEYLL